MQSCRGFTLIELSIVLIVIGLITGSILVGRDLVHAAEIRATISQEQRYNTAVNTFKLQYGYLPGDMPPNAASQLGFFAFTGSNAGAAGYGDGNGQIDNPSLNPLPMLYGEQMVFWRHLSDAGLIDGQFGVTLDPDGQPISLTPVSAYLPPAKMGRSLYFVIVDDGQAPPTANLRPGDNYFELVEVTGMQGGIYVNADLDGATGMAGVTPLEAYDIDTKIDDGMPNSGNVLQEYPAEDWGGSWAAMPTPGACATGGSSKIDKIAVYNTGAGGNGTTLACAVAFDFAL